MRILDEQNLSVLWSWGQLEEDELSARFRTNLIHLLESVRTWMAKGTEMRTADLESLASELQDAAELLDECRTNCYDLAATLHTMAGEDEKECGQRRRHLRDLGKAVGKEVRLAETSVEELKDRKLILDEIRGIKGIVKDGNDYWVAPLDRIEIVDERVLDAPAQKLEGGPSDTMIRKAQAVKLFGSQ